MGTSLEFRILGPLEVWRDGAPVRIGGPRQRALLALLLCNANRVVSRDQLVDELMSDQPADSAERMLHVQISRLRKAIAGDGEEPRLLARPPGYVWRVEEGELDLDEFERLLGEGRRARERGDPEQTAAKLRDAESMWRGRPLADLEFEPFARLEVQRLEELRVLAVEERIDAELALGWHAALVPELEALVEEHPLRERLRGQLMLALYRTGRQADALARYRAGRSQLVEEFALEPSPQLRQLEQAILTQDGSLQLEHPGEAALANGPVAGDGGVRRRAEPEPAPLPARPTRRRLHRRPLIAAFGAVLLAAAAAVAVGLSGSGARGVSVPPNSLAAIDTHTNHVVGTVPLGARPGGVAFGSGSLWVVNFDDQTVSRVDPRTLRTLHTIPVGGAPTGIATSARGVWVVESNLNPDTTAGTSSVLVDRLDPEFDAPGNPVTIGNVVPSGPGAIAAHGDSVWVAPSTGLVTRLNATTGQVAWRLDPNASPAGIAVGEGAIWLTDSEADNVVRVDPTGLLTPIAVGNGPGAITVGAGGVWVVDSIDEALVRIDPGTRSVTATIRVGRSPAGVAFGAGSVWVANSGDGTVTRINAYTDKVQATIAVGGSPQTITIADGRAWVTVDAQSIAPDHGVSGGGTLRIVSSLDVHTMDPGLAYSTQSWRLLYATCAQLVNYPDKAGAAGSQLTPEVAQSLPARSLDARTYTFRIRTGFRFSPPSGQLVTAQTFKDSIERTLNPRMHSPLARYLADVVGARVYMAGKASHITGVVADRDLLTIKLLAPAPDFLARLALPAFCAVPSNTPINRNGVPTVPSAGPYYVTSFTPGQGVVLMRNPNYHGSRPRHFVRVELSVGIPAQRAVAEINAGSADYTVLGLDSSPASSTIAALASQLAARFGPGSAAASHGRQRYFVNPILQLDSFIFNTHRPLFGDVRLRQAVNYAIDRQALAARGSAFQPLPERPTDHYLPPGISGFRDARIYPMAPDLVKARRLVRLAHAAGRTAVLYTFDAPPGPVQAQIVKTDLEAIGIHVQIRMFPSATLFSRLGTPGQPFDIGYSGWQADYPDPSQILNLLLADGLAGPPFDDPASQRRLATAATLSGPARYLTYGKLDLALARNAAPLVAFGNASSHDFFSARIGCQTFGIYGMDLAALCTKHTHR